MPLTVSQQQQRREASLPPPIHFIFGHRSHHSREDLRGPYPRRPNTEQVRKTRRKLASCPSSIFPPRFRMKVVERKVFWMLFIGLGLIADFVLPLWWGVAATIPILFVSWWIAYRSDWF